MRFALFLSSLLLFSFAMNATRPIISLYAADTLYASPFIIGVLVSAYALFPMMFALSIGKLLDRYGARMVVMIGGCGMVVALLIPVYSPSLFSILLSQLFAGFCNICIIISYQKTVGNRVGDRDKNVMSLTLMFAFAEFLGPLVSGFTYQYLDFQWTLFISSMCALLAIVIALFNGRDNWKGGIAETVIKKKSFVDSLGLLKSVNVRKLLLLSAVILYTKDILVAYFPVYGHSIGLSASMIGLILSVSSGMAILVRFCQYWLVRTFGRKKLIFGMLLLSGFSFALIPLFSSVALLFILAGLIGIGLGLGQPISLVYTLNLLPKERHGEILGMRVTFNKGSQFMAPFLFGAIGGIAGIMPIFLITGLFLLASAYGTRINEDQAST